MDILVEGKKVGQLNDVNPIYIDSDLECQNMLVQLRSILPMIEHTLINKCLIVTTSTDGDTVEFGPLEIVELTVLASKYPEKHNEIMACADHLLKSIDYEGELPENCYLAAAALHADLAKVIEFK